MQLLEKPWKNVKKHRHVKLVTTEARENFLVSKENYHRKKKTFGKIIGNKNHKT